MHIYIYIYICNMRYIARYTDENISTGSRIRLTNSKNNKNNNNNEYVAAPGT